MRNPEGRSWSSTVKWWVLIALAFLFSAAGAYTGERAWWVLTIAFVSGLLLTLGVGYVVVRGVWWVTVALAAKMIGDVKKRVEEAPWHITEQRRGYVRSERFAQQLADDINDHRRRKFRWWWPFRSLQFKLSSDDLEAAVILMIGWGLSGHVLEHPPGVFRFHRLVKFSVQNQSEIESILPDVMASVRTRIKEAN